MCWPSWNLLNPRSALLRRLTSDRRRRRRGSLRGFITLGRWSDKVDRLSPLEMARGNNIIPANRRIDNVIGYVRSTAAQRPAKPAGNQPQSGVSYFRRDIEDIGERRANTISRFLANAFFLRLLRLLIRCISGLGVERRSSHGDKQQQGQTFSFCFHEPNIPKIRASVNNNILKFLI